jgi:predicted transglutaminase-like cysteine proteinase
MRRAAKILAFVAIASAVLWASVAEAKIPATAEPVLPPIGHSRFCLRYPADCKVREVDARHRNIALTPKRLNELNAVNRQVNRDIIPEMSFADVASQEWLISPRAGDCKDYAITKRHQLLMRGWPSRALLLSEVVIPNGQHHLVLVVHLKGVDLVLDNLTANIQPVARTSHQYQWVRIESPENPKFWLATVNIPGALHIAMMTDRPSGSGSDRELGTSTRGWPGAANGGPLDMPDVRAPSPTRFGSASSRPGTRASKIVHFGPFAAHHDVGIVKKGVLTHPGRPIVAERTIVRHTQSMRGDVRSRQLAVGSRQVRIGELATHKPALGGAGLTKPEVAAAIINRQVHGAIRANLHPNPEIGPRLIHFASHPRRVDQQL